MGLFSKDTFIIVFINTVISTSEAPAVTIGQ